MFDDHGIDYKLTFVESFTVKNNFTHRTLINMWEAEIYNPDPS